MTLSFFPDYSLLLLRTQYHACLTTSAVTRTASTRRLDRAVAVYLDVFLLGFTHRFGLQRLGTYVELEKTAHAASGAAAMMPTLAAYGTFDGSSRL